MPDSLPANNFKTNMPYSLYELNKMSKEQLENLANELNIKGAKKMDSESLAFAILDTQAQAESLKTSQEKTTKKRGRPRKDASPAKESNEVAESAKETENQSVETPKKSRSRKKSDTSAEAVPIDEKAPPRAWVRRIRPEKLKTPAGAARENRASLRMSRHWKARTRRPKLIPPRQR